MKTKDPPDDIEQQLAALRSALEQDVRELADKARHLVDWRNHFRAHPWLYCGGAAALGWLIVPRRERSLWVEAAIDTRPNEEQPVVLRQRGAAVGGESMLKSLLTLAVTTIARESLGYLVQRFRRDP